MTAPFIIRVRGRSGHASMPGLADNALLKAAPLIERISAYRPEPEHGPETEGFFRALTGEVPPADNAVETARAIHPLAGDLIEPLLQMTFAPTMISASQKRNVIPAVCEVAVDCRLRPGQTPADAEAAMRDALGEGDWEFELISAQGGTRSSLDTPLWGAIEAFVAESEPDALVAPVCCAGFTDSHWLREAFGTVAYGFFPSKMDPELMARLIHSADERALVDDLELGVEFFRHAARTVLG
jgi:acetylornithine deacetylase/succinyl-diaminopimelate desuccinylase-like protein